MGKALRRLLAILMALTILTIIPGITSAAQTKTITIQPGQAYIIEFDSFIQTSLSYQVRVIDGPNVDVILTDETGYAQYNNMAAYARYYPEASSLDVRYASLSDNLQGGHYYFIIDNTMMATAQPNGQSATVSITFSTLPGPLVVILAMVLVGTLAFVILAYKRKWGRWKKSKIEDTRLKVQTLPHKVPVRIYTNDSHVTEPSTVVPIRVHVNGYCSKCGRPLPVGAKYCMICGTAIMSEGATV